MRVVGEQGFPGHTAATVNYPAIACRELLRVKAGLQQGLMNRLENLVGGTERQCTGYPCFRAWVCRFAGSGCWSRVTAHHDQIERGLVSKQSVPFVPGDRPHRAPHQVGFPCSTKAFREQLAYQDRVSGQPAPGLDSQRAKLWG